MKNIFIFNSYLLISLLTLMCSCSEQKSKVNKTIDSFNLETDIYDFSNKLNENDTLSLIVNSSVCTSSSMDSVLFIKRNNKITINTTSYNWTFGEEVYKLGNVVYQKSKDSLNYEDLFKFMKKKSVKKDDINSTVFTLNYKSDTLNFYSSSLIDLMTNIHYFYQIQHKLYPNAEPYKPVYAPKE